MSLVKVLRTIPFGTRSVSVGPSLWEFAGPHSSTVVKGEEVGKGRALRKGGAKDEAARMALEALSSDPPPRVLMLTLRRRNSFP